MLKVESQTSEVLTEQELVVVTVLHVKVAEHAVTVEQSPVIVDVVAVADPDGVKTE